MAVAEMHDHILSQPHAVETIWMNNYEIESIKKYKNMKIRKLALFILALCVLGVAIAQGSVVQLGDFRSILFEYEAPSVSESEVESQIDFMRSLYAYENEMGELQLPELTDEFVKENLNCDSMEVYRARMYEILLEEKEETALQEAKISFLNALIEISEVDLDAEELTRKVEEYRKVYQQYMIQAQLDWASFCQNYFAMSVTEFEEALNAQAEFEISSAALIEAIANEMQIEADELAFVEMKDQFQSEYGLSNEALAERYPDDQLMKRFREECVWTEITGTQYLLVPLKTA